MGHGKYYKFWINEQKNPKQMKPKQNCLSRFYTSKLKILSYYLKKMVNLTSYNVQISLWTLTCTNTICSRAHIESFIRISSIVDSEWWLVYSTTRIFSGIRKNDICCDSILYFCPGHCCVDWVGSNCAHQCYGIAVVDRVWSGSNVDNGSAWKIIIGSTLKNPPLLVSF